MLFELLRGEIGGSFRQARLPMIGRSSLEFGRTPHRTATRLSRRGDAARTGVITVRIVEMPVRVIRIHIRRREPIQHGHTEIRELAVPIHIELCHRDGAAHLTETLVVAEGVEGRFRADTHPGQHLIGHRGHVPAERLRTRVLECLQPLHNSLRRRQIADVDDDGVVPQLVRPGHLHRVDARETARIVDDLVHDARGQIRSRVGGVHVDAIADIGEFQRLDVPVVVREGDLLGRPDIGGLGHQHADALQHRQLRVRSAIAQDLHQSAQVGVRIRGRPRDAPRVQPIDVVERMHRLAPIPDVPQEPVQTLPRQRRRRLPVPPIRQLPHRQQHVERCPRGQSAMEFGQGPRAVEHLREGVHHPLHRRGRIGHRMLRPVRHPAPGHLQRVTESIGFRSGSVEFARRMLQRVDIAQPARREIRALGATAQKIDGLIQRPHECRIARIGRLTRRATRPQLCIGQVDAGGSARRDAARSGAIDAVAGPGQVLRGDALSRNRLCVIVFQLIDHRLPSPHAVGAHVEVGADGVGEVAAGPRGHGIGLGLLVRGVFEFVDRAMPGVGQIGTFGASAQVVEGFLQRPDVLGMVRIGRLTRQPARPQPFSADADRAVARRTLPPETEPVHPLPGGLDGGMRGDPRTFGGIAHTDQPLHLARRIRLPHPRFRRRRDVPEDPPHRMQRPPLPVEQHRMGVAQFDRHRRRIVLHRTGGRIPHDDPAVLVHHHIRVRPRPHARAPGPRRRRIRVLVHDQRDRTIPLLTQPIRDRFVPTGELPQPPTRGRLQLPPGHPLGPDLPLERPNVPTTGQPPNQLQSQRSTLPLVRLPLLPNHFRSSPNPHTAPHRRTRPIRIRHPPRPLLPHSRLLRHHRHNRPRIGFRSRRILLPVPMHRFTSTIRRTPVSNNRIRKSRTPSTLSNGRIPVRINRFPRNLRHRIGTTPPRLRRGLRIRSTLPGLGRSTALRPNRFSRTLRPNTGLNNTTYPSPRLSNTTRPRTRLNDAIRPRTGISKPLRPTTSLHPPPRPSPRIHTPLRTRILSPRRIYHPIRITNRIHMRHNPFQAPIPLPTNLQLHIITRNNPPRTHPLPRNIRPGPPPPLHTSTITTTPATLHPRISSSRITRRTGVVRDSVGTGPIARHSRRCGVGVRRRVRPDGRLPIRCARRLFSGRTARTLRVARRRTSGTGCGWAFCGGSCGSAAVRAVVCGYGAAVARRGAGQAQACRGGVL
ncbi:hypothetical protein NRB20_62990 [Nocardia sp. RB20]|uniref:Uncharacterized protein n=1 Tax=Nocardia macrotermitis TaxID=2585198 RepID=A0A7K0DCW8_9NOCA|nr:hypothetical protein [Nocardia macrotermitis]